MRFLGSWILQTHIWWSHTPGACGCLNVCSGWFHFVCLDFKIFRRNLLGVLLLVLSSLPRIVFWGLHERHNVFPLITTFPWLLLCVKLPSLKLIISGTIHSCLGLSLKLKHLATTCGLLTCRVVIVIFVARGLLYFLFRMLLCYLLLWGS